MTKLTITLTNINNIHSITIRAYNTDTSLADEAYIPTITNAWAFDGGDAVNVVSGGGRTLKVWTILRFGTDVQVYEGGSPQHSNGWKSRPLWPNPNRGV